MLGDAQQDFNCFLRIVTDSIALKSRGERVRKPCLGPRRLHLLVRSRSGSQ